MSIKQALLWTLPFWVVPAFVLVMLVAVPAKYLARLLWFSITEKR